MNGAKYRDILDENLLQRTQDLRLGRRHEWLRDNSLNVLEGPGLEPDRTSLERPENSCAATLPIKPDRN
jgi:hypothetical protein